MITIKKFSLLPYIHLVIVTNMLTEESQRIFDSEWDYYITFEYGWLIWHYRIEN